jgi:hypothetical protein
MNMHNDVTNSTGCAMCVRVNAPACSNFCSFSHHVTFLYFFFQVITKACKKISSRVCACSRIMPKRKSPAEDASIQDIRTLFSPRTPLQAVNTTPTSRPSASPPAREKTKAVRNLKYNQMSQPRPSGAAQPSAAQKPNTTAEEDLMETGTTMPHAHRMLAKSDIWCSNDRQRAGISR